MKDFISIVKKNIRFIVTIMLVLMLIVTSHVFPSVKDALLFEIAIIFALVAMFISFVKSETVGNIKRNYNVTIEKLKGGQIPNRATSGSNGYDCRMLLRLFNKEYLEDKWKYCRGFSVIDVNGSLRLILKPGGKVILPLGFKLGLPEGIKCMVLPKSGIALKSDLFIPNSPGLIDTDYKGEAMVILTNVSKFTIELSDHKEICQLTFDVCPTISFKEGLVKIEGERGTGGHGSTGGALTNGQEDTITRND